MPEYINNSYSKIFQLTWYCGIYKDDRRGLCPHDACNSKQEIRHIHKSHDKTQKHRKIKKRTLNKRIIGIQREDFYLVRIGKIFMKFFCMQFKYHLFGVLGEKKKVLYYKRQIWETLSDVCLPELLPSQLTSWLEEPASQFRDYTHKVFISWVWLEARVWSFDTMVNGTEKTLDTGPLGKGLLPDLRKERNYASFPAWTLSPKDVMLGVMATILISGGKARELQSSQCSSKTETNPGIPDFQTSFYVLWGLFIW